MVKAGSGKQKRNIEDQAWRVGADNAFESDLFGTITEIAIQMFRRKSKGHKLGALDMKFLSDILEAKEGQESFAGAIAKAAAPKETQNPEDEATADSIEQRIAEIMHQAGKTVELFATLADDKLGEEEAKAGAERMEGIARVLRTREEERARKGLRGVDNTDAEGVGRETAQMVKRRRSDRRHCCELG